jgi:hypothetical protein
LLLYCSIYSYSIYTVLFCKGISEKLGTEATKEMVDRDSRASEGIYEKLGAGVLQEG